MLAGWPATYRTQASPLMRYSGRGATKLVPLPPFMTSMTAIDSCNTNCTARLTNAGLRLINSQHNA